jgi:hypothetical protein
MIGGKQVFTPVMWRIPVPPRLHVFLWVLINNKVGDIVNNKRKHIDDKTCLFCFEPETDLHIFFVSVIRYL